MGCLLRKESIDVLGDLFALVVSDAVKEYGDIKASVGGIFGAHDYSVAFDRHIAAGGFIRSRKRQFNENPGKRRDVLIDVAISAQAADILRGGGEIKTVSRNF